MTALGLRSMAVDALGYDDPCSECGTPIPVGDLALITPDCEDFYCFACVTRYYEAMKAAQ